MKLAVYGTLKRGCPNHKRLGLDEALRFDRNDWLRGFNLYDIGRFPGIIQEENSTGVAVEVFTVLDYNILSHLDQYEGYDPRDLKDSLFRRSNVYLYDGTKAQVYVYNEPLMRDHQQIMSGVWTNEDRSRTR